MYKFTYLFMYSWKIFNLFYILTLSIYSFIHFTILLWNQFVINWFILKFIHLFIY